MTTFHIHLSPQRRDDRLTLVKRGNCLLFNGEGVNFSSADAATVTNQWIARPPEKTNDGWKISVILPHGATAPRSTRFPNAITVTEDGDVDLPDYEGPDEDQRELIEMVLGKLAARTHHVTTVNDTIHIPKRLFLREMPKGVFFSETAVPFERQPSFGAVVAHVIGTVSLLELEMLRPAVSQHGAGALLALKTAFRALDRDENKRRLYIRYVAKSTGKERVWETINWAYRFSKPLFEVRNRFAHHIWGECPAIPDSLLLAEPMDRLTGQAAMSQLLGHREEDETAQTLIRIATGEGGSQLSEADAKAIFEIAAAQQNNPARTEAFEKTSENLLDARATSAEVWTSTDFLNAAHAADLTRAHVLERLQQISQWLDGLRSEDELEPLPANPQEIRKR